MAQFVLDTSQLDVDVLGPITFATASASLGSATATATAEIDNIVAANALTRSIDSTGKLFHSQQSQTAGSLGDSKLCSAKHNHAKHTDKATKENKVQRQTHD